MRNPAACRGGVPTGHRPGHPRQGGIQRVKLQKSAGEKNIAYNI